MGYTSIPNIALWCSIVKVYLRGYSKTVARKKKPVPRTGRRGGAAERQRLFAAAWIANGGNGQEAARTAGYTGKDAALRVTASRLLTNANVQDRLRAKVDAVEHGMKSEEILSLLTKVARMVNYLDREEPNVFDFVTFLKPDGSPALETDGPMVAEDIADAKRQVKEAEAAAKTIPGFAIDLPKAKALGKGHLVRELAHDAETGAPKIKLGGDRVAILQAAVRALDLLARCKGLYRDAPPLPPRPDLTAEQAFRLMPEEIQEAWHAAYKEALAKSRAINVEAKRIGG